MKLKNLHTLSRSIAFAAAAVFAISCNDDYLERYPLSDLAPENYFTNESELATYCNRFYTDNLGDIVTSITSPVDQGDDIATNTVPTEYQSNLRYTPGSGGGWSWSSLRSINFFLEHSSNCDDAVARRTYDGVARFWRAYFYFERMKRFGDVPWYDQVIEQNDTELLMKPRDSRDLVYANIIADLDYAIKYAPETKDACTVSRWTAMLLKTRVCLFEGTYRKYRGMDGWEDMLEDCAETADEMMRTSGYSIYTDPESDQPYADMFLSSTPCSEFILARTYNNDLNVNHYLNLHIQGPSQTHPSMTRSLFLSYLCSDGTRYTDKPGYQTEDFYTSTQDRDPRLSQSIRTQKYKYPGSNTVLKPIFSDTETCYQISKYVTAATTVNGDNCLPYMRYAEVLLNFAEAKAELGIITQDDADRSINLLRDRVKMPHLNIADANARPDDFLAKQYRNVSGDCKGAILEVRRERRVELFLEGFRFYDIVRWKEGWLFTEKCRGAYIKVPGKYDIDGNGSIDVVFYSETKPTDVKDDGTVEFINIAGRFTLSEGLEGEIIANPNINRSWDEERDYLYPIPLEDLRLNPYLVQNPKWERE